ncbi:hypothetical protein AB0A81_37625 [Streptomyces flaveolus]|uniref:DUF302 domain-containing protein n=1 Tax=Streptomyces flaveolus TaxID=67297 RepID=A0ABV1VKX8_9ACTN
MHTPFKTPAASPPGSKQHVNRRTTLGAGLGALTATLLGINGKTATAAAEPSGTSAVVHTDKRLAVATGVTYAEALSRFEAAVPSVPSHTALVDVAESGGTAGLKAFLDPLSEYGLFRFFKLDTSGLMNLLGDPAKGCTYVVGNPYIAETMYRYDAGILQYAPLRMTIHEDHEQGVRFLIDQPSRLFAGFDHPEILRTGRYLDQAVGRLLKGMSFPVPPELA